MGFLLLSSGGILELGFWIFMRWMIQNFCLRCDSYFGTELFIFVLKPDPIVKNFGRNEKNPNLLRKHVISEPFEPSPFMPGGARALEDSFNPVNSKQEKGEADIDASVSLPMDEKDNTRENNVAKIRVVA